MALATALGINVGVAVWVLAAALGLAAAIRASQAVFDAVRLAAAVYLIYLGVRSLVSAHQRKKLGEKSSRMSHRSEASAGRSGFRQGLASNLLNPKMAVFFTSLLPQFIGRGSDPLPGLLMLGAIFNALGLLWLVSFALVAARSRTLLSRPRIQGLQERLTGCVLIALGVRIAVERR